MKDFLLQENSLQDNRVFKKLFYLISKSLRDPLNIGLGVKKVETWPSKEIEIAFESIYEVLKRALDNDTNSTLAYYSNLFNATQSIFQEEFDLYKKNFISPKDIYSTNNSRKSVKKSKNDIEKDLTSYRTKFAVCITICVLIQSKLNDNNVKNNFFREKNLSSLSRNIVNLNESISRFLSDNYNEFSLYPDLLRDTNGDA